MFCSGGFAAATNLTSSPKCSVSDAAFEDDSHERVLHRRRGGVDLVEEHQAPPGVVCDCAGPSGRVEHHTVVGADGQAGEVGCLVQRHDHRLDVPARGGGDPLDGLGLAGARVAPQKHRHVGGQQDLRRGQRLGLAGGRHQLAGRYGLLCGLFQVRHRSVPLPGRPRPCRPRRPAVLCLVWSARASALPLLGFCGLVVAVLAGGGRRLLWGGAGRLLRSRRRWVSVSRAAENTV